METLIIIHFKIKQLSTVYNITSGPIGAWQLPGNYTNQICTTTHEITQHKTRQVCTCFLNSSSRQRRIRMTLIIQWMTFKPRVCVSGSCCQDCIMCKGCEVRGCVRFSTLPHFFCPPNTNNLQLPGRVEQDWRQMRKRKASVRTVL